MRITKAKLAASIAVMACLLGALVINMASQATAAQPLDAAVDRPDFHWRGIGPGLAVAYGISLMQMHPTNPDIIIGGADMGTCVRTVDGGKTWKIIGESGHMPPAQPGAPLHRVVFDFKKPQIVWLATGKGLYKSTDTGESWILNFQGEGRWAAEMNALAIDPTDDNIIYAANGDRVGTRDWTRGNVYKTTDGGKTWKTMPRPGGPVVLEPGHTFPNPVRNYYNLLIDPSSPYVAGKGHQRLYLAGKGGFFVSEDAGESWASLEENVPGGSFDFPQVGNFRVSAVCDVALAPSADGKDMDLLIALHPHLASKGKQLVGGVYRSPDRGKTWVALNHGLDVRNGPHDRASYCTFVHPLRDPRRWYLRTDPLIFSACCYRTDNAGQNWSPIINESFLSSVRVTDFDGKKDAMPVQLRTAPSPASYEGVVAANDPNRVCLAGDLSVDGGTTWSSLCYDFGAAFADPLPFPELKGIAPSACTNLNRAHGFTMTAFSCGKGYNWIAIDPFDPKTIAIRYGDPGMRISRDGGQWWEWAYNGIIGQGKFDTGPVLFDPRVRGRLFVAPAGVHSAGSRVYLSDDSGKSFHPIGIPQLDDERAKMAAARGIRVADLHQNTALGVQVFVNAMALDTTRPASDIVLYAASSAGMFMTADAGKSWNDLSGSLPGRNLGGLLWNADQPRRLYTWFHRESYAEKASGAYRSDDAGQSWRRVGAKQLGHVYYMAQCKSQPQVLVAVAAAVGAVQTNVVTAMETRRRDPFWQAWRSDDGGDTWRLLNPRPASLVAIHPINPDIVYLGLGGTNDLIDTELTGLFVSRDGGKSWLDANKGAAFTLSADGAVFPNRNYNNCFAFDPRDPQHIIVGSHSCVYEGRCPFGNP